uniref:Myosin heavy chain n=1 Tax=Ascaris suum TaxID=6253 RepID=F1KUN2_ASCSU
MKALFPKMSDEMTRSRRQSLCASTVSHVYKEQLLNLLETLNTTRAQFIRCISPNDHRQPGVIDPHLVLHQLRCNGVLEGVRICRQGYPNRLPFDEFVSRYKLLSCDYECKEDRDGAMELCQHLDLDPSLIQIGTTKVFCKVGVISELERRRRAKLSAVVCGIQASIRWYNEQKEYHRRLKEREALVIIQTNVRNYAELSSWNWYRLFGLVKQMIPMNKDKERIEELEKENEQLLNELSETQAQYERIEALLKEARKKIIELENEKNDREDEKREMRAEMLRNEEVMAIMEKRFDEQHSKVMKIHGCLRENEKKIEQIEAEKVELQSQLCKWKEKYERESVHRRDLEEECTKHESLVEALQKKVDAMSEEREREGSQVQQLEAELATISGKNAQHLDTINDLQKRICELNEKCRDCDSLVSGEKKARRRAEIERDDKESELETAREQIQKSDIKIENLKELCRDKDRQIKKLQEKLDDTVEKAEVNINEMKKIHKQSKSELQDRVDELKKTVQKLESENRAQKMRIDSSERESSVESDYVSGRQSRLGSRQYSLTSMSSFSSVRTLSRRTTEPDIKVPSSGWRSPSAFSMTYQRPVDSYALSRSNSQSQIANERRIAQLERQILNAHTDIEIQKREIDVYKASLAENEKERDSLSQKVRTLTAEAKSLERSISDEERKREEYEHRLKKTQDELAALRAKYEKSIKDSQIELLEEKRRMRQKMDELIKEQEALKAPRNSHLEKTLEETQQQLSETRAQLDRAVAQVSHLESLSKSQGAYGETWENQYRLALAELESLRDENACLKMKIRRQYKQIELLTQQSEMEADVVDLENRVGIVHREDNKTESSNGDNREQMIEI